MEPLTYRTPFIAATFTCAISWIMNIVYVFILRHADNRRNHRKEGVALHSVMEKKTVHWDAIFDLSDIFWWFLVVAILFGASMQPFLHLSRLVKLYIVLKKSSNINFFFFFLTDLG